MKILSKEQSYEADRRTLAAQGISSTELMERAAASIFNWLHNRLQGAPVRIHIFCGTGNNGGDGLAVARHLAEHGYHIQVYLVNYSEKRSGDFRINLERLRQRKIEPESLDADSGLPDISEADILLDAIFGIGLSRPPAPWVRNLIAHLNAADAFRLEGVEDVAVAFAPADGGKCARCWRIMPEVTESREICQRCDDVVNAGT